MLQRAPALVVLTVFLLFHLTSDGDRPVTLDTPATDEAAVRQDGTPAPLVAHFLWEEVTPTAPPGTPVRGQDDLQTYMGDAWLADDSLMLARYLWGEEAMVDTSTDSSGSQPQQLTRFLWEEMPSNGNANGSMSEDMEVRPFIGDAWMTDGDLMLARFLWQEASGTQPTRTEPEVGRFLWQEAPSSRVMDNADMDVDPSFVGDAWMADDGVMLARYLWEEAETAEGTGSQQAASPRLARFLWQEASTPEDNGEARDRDVQYFTGDAWIEADSPMIARYLWQEAPAAPAAAIEEDRYVGDAWVEADGQMLARYLWQEEQERTNEPPRPKLARYLWQEAQEGETSPPAPPQFARYLWQETVPKGFTEEESPDKDVLPFMGDAWVADDELMMARYLWQEEAQSGNGGGQRLDALEAESFVVTGRDYEALMVHLAVLGATPTATLPAIRSVEVDLTPSQLARLSREKVRGLVPNVQLQTASVGDGNQNARQTEFPGLIDADVLHREGVRGEGVGIAVIDTGIWKRSELEKDTSNKKRVTMYYDAINDVEGSHYEDESGHGTHITSVMASSHPSYDENGKLTGSYHGVAPDADLVVVRSFDANGSGTYMDVIRGINYVIEHKDEFNIRVLNLSFSGEPVSHYWEDPINLAVMQAWQAGIVVVASAGNSGPDPLSIGVPGNVPYIVTVGAMTDSYTPDDPSDDKLASFSSVGPTLEGHVKPDLIAPGGHLVGVMDKNAEIAESYPEFHDGGKFFQMSGTSQASAVASGVAALMIQMDPSLTPDDVKCRLMNSAHLATTAEDGLGYSVFQQGSGLVNALDAVLSDESGCVNQGLDIAAELNDEMHFGGPAQQDEDGTFVLFGDQNYEWEYGSADQELLAWSRGYFWNVGYFWNRSVAWNSSVLDDGGTYGESYEANGYFWNVGYFWNRSYVSNSGYFWNRSQTWNVSELNSLHSASLNDWVKQE